MSFSEKSISKVFGRIKWQKKETRNIKPFLVKKNIVKLRLIFSTALVRVTFYVKYCSLLA